jgi:hypothetical protein
MKRTTPFLHRPFTPLRLTHDTTPEQSADALLRSRLNRRTPSHIDEPLQDAKFCSHHNHHNSLSDV